MIYEQYNKNTCVVILFLVQRTAHKKQISINKAHVRQVVLSTLLNILMIKEDTFCDSISIIVCIHIVQKNTKSLTNSMSLVIFIALMFKNHSWEEH